MSDKPASQNDHLPILTHVRIRNYRCLEAVDIPLGPLTAFVGPNGSGKTTILRAIDLVLGDAWPSLRSSALQSVDIGFGFADPANPFNSLRLEYRESGLTIPGEELGLGIQSAMVVGVFEAFRQIGGPVGIVIIEEPEMYLHPQAQRYFYRLICEMADKRQCQVIYSTHSPVFSDVNRFETLRLVRREGRKTSVAFVQEDDVPHLEQARNNFKIGNRFDAARNEILFARCALLCEGYGDRIAVLLMAEKLGFDPDAEGCAVIDCGGKAGIELFVRVCQTFKIPFLVLHDEDVWPVGAVGEHEGQRREQQNRSEQSANQRIREAVADDTKIFMLRPSLEAILGIPEDARDKPRKVHEKLEGIDLENLPDGLQPLKNAVEQLKNI